jgi:nucleoside-diphosphate-sugar epimerase
MTMLITGTGLVGPHVARILIEEWEQRPALYGTLRNPAQVADLRDQADVVRGDILNLADLVAAVQKHGVDTIVHTAILMDGADDQPWAAVQTNVLGTVNVIEAARLGGVRRVVNASSGNVYAPPVGGARVQTETDSVGGNQRLYPATKLACEQIGRAYAALHGVQFVNVRLTSMYGPTIRRAGGNGGVIQDAVTQAARGEPISIKRRTAGRTESTYIKDSARGLALAATAERLEWDAINVGVGQAWSLDDVAAVLSELTGLPSEVTGETQSTRDGSVMDLTRARAIGYEPRFDLRAGLRDYLDWTRRQLATG